MEEATVFLDFAPEEYPALAAFLTALHPEEPRDADSLRRFDAGRVAGEHHLRTLAWAATELVGIVETERSRQFTRPVWYGLHAYAADPGLWAELLKRGLDILRPFSPTMLHTTVSEDWPECAWLGQQGWREHERTWLSHLNLTTFRPEAFEDRRARAHAEGIEIRTLRELGWDDSEPFQRRIYELTISLLADVPTTDPVIPWPFEVWRNVIWGTPTSPRTDR